MATARHTLRPVRLLSRSPQITPPGVMPGWCAEPPGAATSLVPTLLSGSGYERSVRTRRGCGMAVGDAPVMEALIEINAASLARTELDARSLMLVRLAALAAVDAPASSYLLHVGPSVEAGLTVEDAEDVLVAVAPIVGAPRTASAAAKIMDALGLAIGL